MTELLLALGMVPIAAVPLLLIFAFRDWAKTRTSTNGNRRWLLGLATLLALSCEWFIPLAIFLAVSIAGVGIEYSTPTATAILVLWSTLVAISVGASFFTLKGSARTEAAIAGLILLIMSILTVTVIAGNLEMT